jgi:hypothetical protein
LITRIMFGGQYKSCSSLCSFLHHPVTSPLVGTDMFLSTVFPNTVSLCSPLNVRDQVSHPYKAAQLDWSHLA